MRTLAGHLFLGLEKYHLKYNKLPLTYDQQVEQLINRGMIIPNREKAAHYLSHLNYYRLSGYWLPFEASHETHQFLPGITFDHVLSLYIFDRELKILIMDAVERIEVSVRTQWAYHLSSRYGSHAHLNSSIFGHQGDYLKTLSFLCNEIARSEKQVFIKHLLNTYDETTPPIWAIVEIMSFGQISKLYSNIRERKDRKLISDHYKLDESVLISFMRHLNIIRNMCAHHSRLWNRKLTTEMVLPKKPAFLNKTLNINERKKIYNSLVMMAYFLDIISPNNHFKCRLLHLLNTHPIADTEQMGFPKDWRNYPFWQI